MVCKELIQCYDHIIIIFIDLVKHSVLNLIGEIYGATGMTVIIIACWYALINE